MELKQYFNIIAKRLWIIILLPLVAALSAGYMSFYILEPVYSASTTLYVTNKDISAQAQINYSDILMGQELVKDYRELIKSRAVTSTVIKELNINNISPEGLAEQINVNSKNDTRILEISVEDGNAESAKKLADKIGQVFVVKAAELMKVDNVSIVDEAVAPQGPIRPRPYMNILIAVFAGLMMAIGIIFLIEYLDDTIKSSEDVEKYLGLSVLGTIPVLNIK